MKTLQSSLPGKASAASNISRLKISIFGVVQGVGFRPFVYQLAARHKLTGWVCNTSGDVSIEAEGRQGALAQFLADLEALAPPLAHIEKITATEEAAASYQSFEIRDSIAEENKYQLVSPDIATCPACLKEVLARGDRRYCYPFTNCTNCGPRFTIIEDIPYDRPRTTMRGFTMCPTCQKEYDNPLDRRFHAQPNACPTCGPVLQLVDKDGKTVTEDDAINIVGRLLREGQTIAVKGLGGFLLACDATSEAAIRRLRERKRRNAKPLAIMLADLAEVKKHCLVNEAEAALLTSPQCPIVLLRRKRGSAICPAVATNLKYLGVMLPYTPLHHLLCREAALPLVMTSGNLSEEPIAKDNDEARRRLGGIADYFLLHNRDIYSRYDDSVAMVEQGKVQILRRARGYAPHPIHLSFKARQVLACGAELKNTFCLTRDEHAFISQHIGDMENLETLEHFTDTIALYRKLFRIRPQIIACDMHPEYLPTKYAAEIAAKDSSLKLAPVQHHHAHIVSCLADNGRLEPVIGVSFDGTGFGTDGCIWGGEFLVADQHGFERRGHLQYVPLPGGAAAIERPYRMAVSCLLTLLGDDALEEDLPFLSQVDKVEIELIRQQTKKRLNAPLTSSAGRLFDAVAALTGIRGRIEYEAQAAIELEMRADEGASGRYPLPITESNGINIVLLAEMFSAIITDIRQGVSPSAIAMKFHRSLAQMIKEMCLSIAAASGINKVALSGGVFQNRLLLRLAAAALESAGLEVLTHHQVPANDGGISLGQAVIASFAGEERL